MAEVGATALAEAGYAVGSDRFHAMWRDASTTAETRADFARARAMGVRSFPALLLDTGERLVEVSGGYGHATALERQLGTLLGAYAN
jgi:putative protein-disulfide isomerase